MASRNQRIKPNLNVGTIGHSQHGKTTLTAAILKVLAEKDRSVQALAIDQIDREPAERERRMTINANQVEYQTSKRHYAHVDCPGHVDYARNMYVAAAQMDAAILVVSATDGIQTQTREHILLARQTNISNLVVFISKCDTVDNAELLDLLELGIRQMLNEYKFAGDDAPIVRGSALKALEGDEDAKEAVAKLIEAVDSLPEPERAIDRAFLMPISGGFTLSGRGTIVSGRIERGAIKVGDEVDIVGGGETMSHITVTGVEQTLANKFVDKAQAGDQVNMCLRGIKLEELSRDKILAKVGCFEPHTKFIGEVYVLNQGEGGRDAPFATGFQPQFYFRLADVKGTITLPEGTETVAPGDNVTFEVELAVPLALYEDMRFVIRDADRTVATGVIVEILA